MQILLFALSAQRFALPSADYKPIICKKIAYLGVRKYESYSVFKIYGIIAANQETRSLPDAAFPKMIPETENPLVLRTDFSDQAAWERICALIRKPVGFFRFRANVEFLEDLSYEGITVEQLLKLLPGGYDHTFICLVDEDAVRLPDHPILVVDLYENSGRFFRAVPKEIQGIENNLSIANMDFAEFFSSVDKDGVFRGFHKS